MELRCPGNKLHGLVIDDEVKAEGIVEFRCSSKFCGYVRDKVVVLHRFDLRTGGLTTRRYSEPKKLN